MDHSDGHSREPSAESTAYKLGARIGRSAKWMVTPALIFLASRFASLVVGVMTARLINAPGGVLDALSRWDGAWYLRVAATGYVEAIPPGTGDPAQTNLVFFPAYSLVFRWLSQATGLPLPAAGIIVSILAGTIAAILLYALAQRLTSKEVAIKTVALFSFFPGAFVLSQVYSEALFLVFAIAALTALIRERWALAGVAGALAGATRPGALAIVACSLWAGGRAALQKRSLRPLIAPILAPLGILAFFAYLWAHTGDALIWFEAQMRGWGLKIDFGATAWRVVSGVLRRPLFDFNHTMVAIGFVAVVFGGYLLWRWKPPSFGTLAIYSAGIVGPLILSNGFSVTPRAVMTAFPLLIAFARYVNGSWFVAVLAISASMMAALQMLAGAGLITP